MKDISVLIPYRPDNGPRDVVFHYVIKYYATLMPEAELCIGESNPGLFSRSQGINNAAQKATRKLFVIADADLIYDPAIIYQSIELLKQYAWAIPYSRVDYLSHSCTDKIIESGHVWPINIELEIISTTTGSVGGLCVVSRKNFEGVGGFDPRFMGWGGEDDAFANSMNTICGHCVRMDVPIYHLWHPRSRANGNPNYQANYELYHRYYAARDNKAAMQQLIKEK